MKKQLATLETDPMWKVHEEAYYGDYRDNLIASYRDGTLNLEPSNGEIVGSWARLAKDAGKPSYETDWGTCHIDGETRTLPGDVFELKVAAWNGDTAHVIAHCVAMLGRVVWSERIG